MKKAILSATLAVALTTTAQAGGGGGATGGATEMTQLMNNAELVESVAQQSSMVSNQIQQYLLQFQQYATQLQNLMRLDPRALASLVGPEAAARLAPYVQAYQTVSSLQTSATRAYNMLSGEISAMTRLSMTPGQYLEAMLKHSRDRSGYLKFQLDQTALALQDVQRRAEATNTLAKEIPGIAGNVQGFGVLAGMNTQLIGEMQNLNASILQARAREEATELTKEQAKEVSQNLYQRDQETIKAMGGLGGKK